MLVIKIELPLLLFMLFNVQIVIQFIAKVIITPFL